MLKRSGVIAYTQGDLKVSQLKTFPGINGNTSNELGQSIFLKRHSGIVSCVLNVLGRTANGIYNFSDYNLFYCTVTGQLTFGTLRIFPLKVYLHNYKLFTVPVFQNTASKLSKYEECSLKVMQETAPGLVVCSQGNNIRN